MLRFDRYLMAASRVLDLASGSLVDLVRATGRTPTCRLFECRHGRTLIDMEQTRGGRIEVWERWRAGRPPAIAAEVTTSFVELLEVARHGVPQAFDLAARSACDRAYLRRLLAREARARGWVPIGVELLAALMRRRAPGWPPWLVHRSLVVFVDTAGLSGGAALALLRLARRDARPHVLVRSLVDRPDVWLASATEVRPSVVHEPVRLWGDGAEPPGRSDVDREAAARWALLIESTCGGAAVNARTLDLAELLLTRNRPFEAQALAERVTGEAPALMERRQGVLDRVAQGAAARAAAQLGTGGISRRGWEMVDDFVGVLQMCQDTEDEQTALARVGAFLRERLQASTVAFVARDGGASRVLARIGADAVAADLAMRSIETGVAIPAARDRGPAESAYPVRHATEVIGAVWCRWSAGTPVASQQASTLLGIAAAATAPSVRIALARTTPVVTGCQIPELVGTSPVMAAVRDAIVKAAASPFPVVIEGESGSGKELAARAIHARSSRRDQRFCAVNCAALVDELVEAELFGHARGAFTGALVERRGLFEEASSGTLLLDEVAELTVRVQAKLLRTLQESEVRRLGETIVRRIDVRVVAATNRPLAREVQGGRFRQDLWYRLDVVRITMPPLRARVEDVPAIATDIWHRLASRTGCRAALAPRTLAALSAYDWPGNVRELQNVLASLLVSAPRGGLVGPAALPVHITRGLALDAHVTLEDARRQFEERYVRAALARAGGRTAEAARELGLTRQGLTKVLERLGIARNGAGAAAGQRGPLTGADGTQTGAEKNRR